MSYVLVLMQPLGVSADQKLGKLGNRERLARPLGPSAPKKILIESKELRRFTIYEEVSDSRGIRFGVLR